jgi:hypothetical protein
MCHQSRRKVNNGRRKTKSEADTTSYKNADTCLYYVDNRRLIAQKGPDHLLNQGQPPDPDIRTVAAGRVRISGPKAHWLMWHLGAALDLTFAMMTSGGC